MSQDLGLVLILAILPEAFPSKGALGVLPLGHLALPTFVGPCGGTEADERGERESHRGENCSVIPWRPQPEWPIRHSPPRPWPLRLPPLPSYNAPPLPSYNAPRWEASMRFALRH